ncbi:MAG: hypothetical protein A4C66_10560 [Nitrospira sp. HN-bin3]|uniref:helix-turn-helix domain-containing protein n=1 Tax=Nitrospira cf. moscoviensis SBR1015 TaxID=96242 RepID=UPI000A0C7EC3|nr:helix-turn-helix domain-containing protein [Nitrospira cf. moscoviensis SBR1015]OQW40691.1 MAG: hypothetical protein A4C66_10560 [Nitrospira sp. HN-bin3]
MLKPLLDIRELSLRLKIKTSTLYAWAEQGKIPAFKINGLWRFKHEEIDPWLESFRKTPPRAFQLTSKPITDLDGLIERAKQEAYNSAHGETRPRPSPREGR